MSAYLTNAATTLLTQLRSDLQELIKWPGINTAAPAALVTALPGLVDTPASIASAVSGFFAGYATAVIAAIAVPFDDTQSSSGVPLPSDWSYGLGDLAIWGNTFPAVGGTSPLALKQAANQAALIALVQQCAVAAMASVFAATEWPSAADADAARTQIMNLIDALCLAASLAGDDDGYQALFALGQAVSADLTTRGKSLPDVVIRSMGAPLPALVLAQIYYSDPARAGELIARNGPANPLFMPVSVEALTQ